MLIVPIKNVPTQRFSIPLDDNEWDIEIRDTNGAIAVSFSRNGQVLLQNIRAVAGRRIIPYKYLESGNFAFITQDQEIPDYTKFGTTQKLVYISQAELDALRATKPVIWTAAEFDPNAALPLRFKPMGYILTPRPFERITTLGDTRETTTGDIRITAAL